jgi:phage-related protein
MKHSTGFIFDGIESSSMGIVQVTSSNGLFEDSFMTSRKIVETKVRGNDKPYFQGIETSPLSFTLSFAFLDTFNEEQIGEIKRWFSQPYYKPFIFSENIGKVYYAMYEGDPKLLHNGLSQGYVEGITMRCKDPYVYSPVTEDLFEFSSNTINGTEFTFMNMGDLDIYPEIYIETFENGDFSILNQSNSGQEMKFTGLVSGETIYIDNENEYIHTDLSNTYRYENHNDVFLSLTRGANYLKVYGKCNIKIKYQLKYLQG